MNLLITGLPGVGKGTQSENIEQEYNAKHISTGDMFRKEMKSGSELGQELADYINKGLLVPDALTIKILQHELLSGEYDNGFLLDGFPRTIVQAEYLNEMLKNNNMTLDAVIALELDEEIIVERLENRRICPSCGATFHNIYVKPEVEGVCDNCKSNLIQREDDTLESILKRLEIAKEQTNPVIDYFANQGVVKVISMEKTDSTSVVFDKIKASLNDYN